MEDKVYKTGQIYKLYSQINEYYYIGSTLNTLRHRLRSHKTSKSRVSRKVSDWIDDIGVDNLKIMEVRKYEDLTAKQLKIYEDDEVRQHLGKEYCLNCRRVYRSSKEYREDNREQIAAQRREYCIRNREHKCEYDKKYKESNKERLAERDKQYYVNNKVRILKQMKEKITCPICNCEVRRVGFAIHEKSQKHKLNLQETKSI